MPRSDAIVHLILIVHFQDLFEKLKMTRREASNAAALHQQAVANASAVEKLLSTYEQEVQRVKKDYERGLHEFAF